MKFYKMSGAQNVFLIGEYTPKNLELTKKNILRWTSPIIGVGADGIVLVEKKEENKLKWHFFNSDGSEAEMCGNAIRCVHHYWNLTNRPIKEVSIQTLAGEIFSLETEPRVYKVKMKIESAGQSLQLENLLKNKSNQNGLNLKKKELNILFEKQGFYIDTGVPHLVLKVSNIEVAMKNIEIIKTLRNHSFFKRGTNVTLVQEIDRDAVKAVTFERGVENFTQACGTGAVAAGIFQSLRTGGKKINIKMPGGIIEYINENGINYLKGDAEEIAKVEFKNEV